MVKRVRLWSLCVLGDVENLIGNGPEQAPGGAPAPDDARGAFCQPVESGLRTASLCWFCGGKLVLNSQPSFP